MSNSDYLPGSGSDRMVERGETYVHAEHGRVEVAGIWKGVTQVDSAHHVNETGVIIVRYSTEQDRKPVDELTDTLDEFLEAAE